MSTHSVLIVEDEQIFALDLQQQLEEMGYDAFGIAASCTEALTQAAERRPDIVLMDIRIAGRRDGVETASLLRREHGVPVIYLTAHGDDATFDRAKASDPYGYLLKPIKSAELRRTLEISLQRASFERAIREREHWFSTTLRSLSDGVVTFDIYDEVQFINPAAHALMFSVKESDEETRARLFDMAALEKPEEFRFEDKEGHLRTVIRAQSLVSDDFSVLGKVLVLRDISEQIEAARQLATAAKMASLGTLAAGVAHEINNPLTVILGTSLFIHDRLREAAEKSTDSDDFSELVELETEVQEAAERIRTIVSGMMVFAHPGPKVKATATIADVVAAAIKSTRFNVEHANVVADLQPHLPPVEIDPGKLSQVLVNLVSNAAQAMAPHQKDVNLISITATCDGLHVEISVSDNGVGMTPETLNQVFDPFFTTKDVGKGTGLGLSICHGIIDSAGGVLSVQSLENSGTTFTISLPCPSEAKAVSDNRPVFLPKILVVDGDEIARRLVGRILDTYDVVACSNLDDAYDRVAQGERFEAILLALCSDGTPGFDFYDRVVELAPELSTRIVFMSGGPFPTSMEQKLQKMPNPTVRKPYNIQSLREIVGVVVHRH